MCVPLWGRWIDEWLAGKAETARETAGGTMKLCGTKCSYGAVDVSQNTRMQREEGRPLFFPFAAGGRGGDQPFFFLSFHAISTTRQGCPCVPLGASVWMACLPMNFFAGEAGADCFPSPLSVTRACVTHAVPDFSNGLPPFFFFFFCILLGCTYQF